MKKFANVLIVTAVIGVAAAAVAYFLSRKKKAAIIIDDEFDAVDDIDDDDEDRSYVSLTQPEAKEDNFTPLKDAVSDGVEKVDEKVEDFFDEEDEN